MFSFFVLVVGLLFSVLGEWEFLGTRNMRTIVREGEPGERMSLSGQGQSLEAEVIKNS